MRTTLLPVIFAVGIAMTGAAMAATTTIGVIKSFDMTAQTMTLEDGTMYHLPSNFTDPGLKIGERVNIQWEKVGNMDNASSVTIVKS